MDVGMTKGEGSSPFHWITGTIVFLSGYTMALLLVRDLLFH